MKEFIFRKQSLYLFLLWLIVGAGIGWAFTKALQPANAEPTADLSKFDSDVHPAIDIVHSPPLALMADEVVDLEFSFVCGYLDQPGLDTCNPTATLFVAWGNSRFEPIQLQQGVDDVAVQHLAASKDGNNIRYYVEVVDQEAGISVRFPKGGFIEPVVISSFTKITLPPPQEAHTESILAMAWGDGENEVGLSMDWGAPAGVNAMDVSPNGTVALYDWVKSRVVLVKANGEQSSFEVPLHFMGDIAINGQGQITIFDFSGEPLPGSTVSVPHLYRFASNGQQLSKGPVFVQSVFRLFDEDTVIDGVDSMTVQPMNSSGHPASRAEQRRSRSSVKYAVSMLTLNQARLADRVRGIGFEMTSPTVELGGVMEFLRIGDVYIVVSYGGGLYQAVWFTPDGQVLANVSMPAEDYIAIFGGNIAIQQDASINILNTNEAGIVVLQIPAP